jgi:hypothetical protein
VGRFVRGPRILVIILPYILMAPVWLTGEALYWGTPSTQFVPWWAQAYRTLATGELPLWNPLVGGGAPLLANYQSALLYPPTWIYFLLAAIGGVSLLAWGQALLLAAHLAWAGLGMSRLARQLGRSPLAQTVAGLAFGMSGYLVARAHFLSINAAVAWLPWILLAAYNLVQKPERRNVLWLAAALAMQWLAGHAQIAAYTLLLALAWLLFWSWHETERNRIWRLAAGSMGLALLVSAAQLLPTLEYLLNSQRAASVDPAGAFTYSFWPWRLIGLLAPNFFGNPASDNYWGYGNFWEDAIYVGLLPLLLALGEAWALRRQPRERRLLVFLGGLSALSLLLALGDNTSVFPWLFEHVPGFALFQSPARWTIWLVFALALLSAYGVDAWRRPTGRALYWSRLALAGAAAAILVAAAGLWLGGRAGLEVPLTFFSASLVFGLLALAAAVLHLNAPPGAEPPPRRWAWIVALLLAADLLYAGWGLNPGAPRELFSEQQDSYVDARMAVGDGRLYMPPETERQLKFEHLFRFDGFHTGAPPEAIVTSLLPNTNLLAGVPSANNFDPFVPGRYQQWLDTLAAAEPALGADLLAMLGVSAIEKLESAQPFRIDFESIDARPRAQWFACAQIANGSEAAWRTITAPGFEGARDLLVEIQDANPADMCASGEGVGTVALSSASSNRVTINVDAPDGGWLLLADTYYPGWVAYVDGVEAPPYPAQGLLRAVQLPAGTESVEFVYEPTSFNVGVGLTLLGLLLMLGAWWRPQSPGH